MGAKVAGCETAGPGVVGSLARAVEDYIIDELVADWS